MSLYTKESGTPGRPSIVFLHGVGAGSWMWQEQVAALVSFHCLNVDLPGHGQSNQIEWVSFADTAQRIAELIRSRATNGRSHIIGLSLGGYIGLVVMNNFRELIDRTIISGVTVEPMPNRVFLKPQVWLMSLMKKPWFGKRQARSLGLSPAMQADYVENLSAMSMQAYDRIMQEASEFNLPTSLREVEIPTLAVAGGNETEIIKQAVHTLAATLPNAQGAFAPGLGHGWNVEDPGLFNAMAQAWLTSTPLPPRLQLIN
jgi:pimeloyl-ACP methyl ester carboxylesterase